MKILIRGNNERGSAFLFSLLLVGIMLLLASPIMSKIITNSLYAKKKYEYIRTQIIEHNNEVYKTYEID